MSLDGTEVMPVGEPQQPTAAVTALIAGWQQRLGQYKHQVDILMEVFQAAEALSTAMVNSEAHGADYDLVEADWSNLTAKIQTAYAELGEGIKHGIR